MSERTTSKILSVALALSVFEAACNSSGGVPRNTNTLNPATPTTTLDAAKPPREVGVKTTLATTLTPELIRRFDLQNIANIPAAVHRVTTADGKPTFLYLYDSSTGVNLPAFETAYDSVGPSGLARYVDALKRDRNPSEYRIIPGDNTLLFRYNYGENNEQLAEVGIFSSSPVTRARHMLFLDEQSIPAWAKGVKAGTRQFLPPGAEKDSSGVFLTIISPGEFKSSNNPLVDLNTGVLTEICQQTVLALNFQGSQPAPAGSVNMVISQEGVCNGLGLAATLKRLRASEEEAVTFTGSTIMAGVYGSPNIRFFPTTRSAYALLPDNGPLVGMR